jgi:hypothetical protein
MTKMTKKNIEESFLQESKIDYQQVVNQRSRTSCIEGHILLPNIIANNVLTFDTREVTLFGANLELILLLKGRKCHIGHEELHWGFGAFWPAVL